MQNVEPISTTPEMSLTTRAVVYARVADGRANRRQTLWISAIVLLALCLRLYRLDAASLWGDEWFSIESAHFPPSAGHRIRQTYFLLLMFWRLISPSDAWGRMLSVLFGTASVYLVYQVGSRLVGRIAGTIAAFAFALSPLEIDHAQEIRLYEMATFVCLLGTLAAIHAIEQPTRRRLLWWAVARFAALMTSPFNVFMLVGDAAVVHRTLRNQFPALARQKWLFALLTIAALPVLYVALRKLSLWMLAWAWVIPHPGLWSVLNRLVGFTTYWPTPMWEVHPTFPSAAIGWFYKVYAILLAVLVGVAFTDKRRSPRLLWCAAWAFLPLGTQFALCHLGRISLWIDRYLMYISPYVLMLLAAGCLRLWRERRALAALIGTVYAVAVGGALVNYYSEGDREDWKGAVQFIQQFEQPGDAIAVPGYLDLFRHYYHGIAPLSLWGLPIGLTAVRADVEPAVSGLPHRRPRLWVVHRPFGLAERQQMFETILAEQYQIARHQALHDMHVYLLTPKTFP